MRGIPAPVSQPSSVSETYKLVLSVSRLCTETGRSSRQTWELLAASVMHRTSGFKSVRCCARQGSV